MASDHCSRLISAVVGAVAGVTVVDVDLTTGKVTVSSDELVSAARIREAVEGPATASRPERRAPARLTGMFD